MSGLIGSFGPSPDFSSLSGLSSLGNTSGASADTDSTSSFSGLSDVFNRQFQLALARQGLSSTATDSKTPFVFNETLFEALGQMVDTLDSGSKKVKPLSDSQIQTFLRHLSFSSSIAANSSVSDVQSYALIKKMVKRLKTLIEHQGSKEAMEELVRLYASLSETHQLKSEIREFLQTCVSKISSSDTLKFDFLKKGQLPEDAMAKLSVALYMTLAESDPSDPLFLELSQLDSVKREVASSLNLDLSDSSSEDV